MGAGCSGIIIFESNIDGETCTAKLVIFSSVLWLLLVPLCIVSSGTIILYVWTRLPRTWWICSNIVLEVGFPDVLVLADIPYYVSIRDFLNSWPINSNTWSYLISIYLEYLSNHVVSTKFTIDITRLSSYCVILNNPVTGYIMVTYLRFKFSFYPFLCMEWISIRYTQSWFRGVSSASLGDNLP